MLIGKHGNSNQTNREHLILNKLPNSVKYKL